MKGCFPNITKATRLKLEADYSLAKTNKALKGMGSLKPPGLDWFPPMLYKSTLGADRQGPPPVHTRGP